MRNLVTGQESRDRKIESKTNLKISTTRLLHCQHIRNFQRGALEKKKEKVGLVKYIYIGFNSIFGGQCSTKYHCDEIDNTFLVTIIIGLESTAAIM